MNPRLGTVLILGLIASLANILGGWIIASRKEISRSLLDSLVAMGGGFMLSAVILEVLPKSFDLNRWAPEAVLGGYLFVHLVEHTLVRHFHFGEETHPEAVLERRTAVSALAGLVLHTFFDGALIAAGFWVSTRLGVILFLAILLHKIPEGFTAASIMRASGRGQRAMHLASLAIGVSTLAGVLGMGVSGAFVATALPFSAGVTIYVAASDLIPEVNKEPGMAISLAVFLGVILFLASDRLLHAVIGA
jgi:ZIP family zinc transporter/zinc and cadmium transporter